MDPAAHRIATGGAFMRAPRLRHARWIRRLKAAVVFVSGMVCFGAVLFLVFLVAHIGG